MKKIYSIIFLQLFVIINLLLNSCKKDSFNDLDQLSIEMSGTEASYIEKGYSVTIGNTSYCYTSDYHGVAIGLSNTVNTTDTIIADVDTSLVSLYNLKFSENNPQIPYKAFSASKNSLFAIENGKSQSLDSLYVELKNSDGLTDSTTYLIPIRMKSKNGNKLKTEVIFFKMYVLFSELYAKIGSISGPTSWIGTPFPWHGGWIASYLNFNNGTPVFNPTDIIKVGISLSNTFPLDDLYVNASVISNDSIVNAYSTAYKSFPTNSYSINKSQVRIPINTLNSTDSLEISLNRQNVPLYNNYLMVLQLSKDTSNNNQKIIVQPGVVDSIKAYISYLQF